MQEGLSFSEVQISLMVATEWVSDLALAFFFKMYFDVLITLISPCQNPQAINTNMAATEERYFDGGFMVVTVTTYPDTPPIM
jgi:hypothetical protein